jgi:hypothetical protein
MPAAQMEEVRALPRVRWWDKTFGIMGKKGTTGSDSINPDTSFLKTCPGVEGNEHPYTVLIIAHSNIMIE